MSLVLCEAVVRVFPPVSSLENAGGYVGDPATIYRLNPKSHFTVTTDEFTYVRRHNSVGFRDVEHSLAKPEGVFRILGLGDSFTYGTGVNVEQTFLSQLETMLNARGGTHPRVEIIKAGVPGFFPEAERSLLERYGLSYFPDLVIVAFLPNDIIDTHRGIGALVADESGYLVTRESARLSPMVRGLARHSSLVRLALLRYLQLRDITAAARDGELFEAGGYHEDDWRAVEAEYARISALAATSRARFAIVHIPQKGPWAARHAYPAVRLEQWSRQHDALFVDTLPALRAAPPDLRLYYPRDGHTTPEGHRVIASVLFTALTAGVVP